MLVEAAAGTGKTTCLIARMVGLLREGKCRIDSLAAVTFTRKAAAELRARFQLALERAAREAAGGDQERLCRALDHVERCFIGTIHSFCARLLRERPVESGVDPGFVELDEVLDQQLLRQAWREHAASLISNTASSVPDMQGLKLSPVTSAKDSSSALTELSEVGLELSDLESGFLQYAQYADVSDWPADSVPLPDLGPVIDDLSAYIRHIHGIALPEDYGNDKLMPRYELIDRMSRGRDLTQPVQLMELLAQFQGSGKVVQKMWPGGRDQALAELDRWNDFVERRANPTLRTWREHRYAPAMKAIRPAVDTYHRLRRERNGLNFQDLLLLSVKLLRDNPQVRSYFRDRFTHLLVDEFQDTDPIQAEVMLLLTGDDIQQTDWQQCRPVPGSLFVVGDPKQSIYRFRRADILTYNKVRQIVQDVGGQVIPLTANFRSTQPVIEWVNACFSGVFPAVANDYSPADRPLDAGRVCGGEQESTAERLVAPAGFTRKDQITSYEADLIARTIRQAVDQQWPVPRTDQELAHGVPEYAQPGDFLIITKGKSQLTVYARKLQKYGLPHSVTGSRVLNEVPELELLQTCLAAVARSDDPIALVAALRSELFGVADTVLYDFRRFNGRFSYYSAIPDELSRENADQLKDAFGRLQSYATWLRQMPAASAIERIAADLGLIARACAAAEGDMHAGSLLKAIELLRSADGPLTIGDYVEAVGRIVDQEEFHDGVPVSPPAETPVRLMNLHQCKGLEAPFVFLADPSGESHHDVSVYIDRTGSEPRGYLPIYGPRQSQWGNQPLLAHPPHWEQLAAEEQRFLDAETDRLLYVAATRAGHRLVISQRNSSGRANQRNPWRMFDAWLPEDSQFVDPGAVKPKPGITLTIEPAEWKAEVGAIERRWQTSVQQTYAVEAVKESAITGGPKPHGAEPGGAAWGDVVHTLLEAVMKQPQTDLRGLTLSALRNEGLPIALCDEVIATVERVVASPLWERAQKSGNCLAEVPLATFVSASETSNGLPTVRRGVIDLAFLESAGWVIVDYKSERVDVGDIPALVTYYRPQVDAYVKAWEHAVGQPVAESGLFFTHMGQYVSLADSTNLTLE